MSTLFLSVFNRSIAAGWLILAILPVRIIIKKVRAPKWTSCLLWAIAAVRLIMPVTIKSICSLIPSAQTLRPDTVKFSAKPAIESGIPFINQTVNPLLERSLSPAPGASVNPLFILTELIGVIWLLGIALLMVYALICCLKLKRQVSESILLHDSIWLCDCIDTPFLFGFFHPKIYLPADVEAETIPYITAHELTHLRRKDNWWKPLGFILTAIYWFHPLVWTAYILFCKDTELACDEAVVKGWDIEDKKAYSDALLTCSIQKGRRLLSCPLSFGETGVKERIKTILRSRKPVRLITVTVLFLCIAIAVCFLTDPKEQAAAEKEQQGESIPQSEIMPVPKAAVTQKLYEPLIQEARAVLQHPEQADAGDENRRFSSVFYQNFSIPYQRLGYLLIDIDGNGVEELIFGENWDNDWNGIVYDIYTISDGQIVHLLEGWERSRYYLCDDGKIAHEWSSSSSENGCIYYQYTEEGLLFLEAVCRQDLLENGPWFYSQEESVPPEDYTPISEEEAAAVQKKYICQYPEFIPFIEE